MKAMVVQALGPVRASPINWEQVRPSVHPTIRQLIHKGTRVKHEVHIIDPRQFRRLEGIPDTHIELRMVGHA